MGVMIHMKMKNAMIVLACDHHFEKEVEKERTLWTSADVLVLPMDY